MKRDDFNHEGCTVQSKTTINFLRVDRRKTTTIIKALKEYENTVASHVIGRRQIVRTGKVVSDYLKDGAAMTKRLFVRLTQERKDKAQSRFQTPIEADKCYRRLRTKDDKAVLKFCFCDGKKMLFPFFHFRFISRI